MERTKRATDRRLAEVRRDADAVRERCRTLRGFVEEAWPIIEPGRKYIHNWHLEAIYQHLEAITFGRFLKMGMSNRLLINIPPGCMKSLTVSVLWQAWEWGPCNMAHLRYLTTSYQEDYVKRDTRKTRDLINSDWYQALWGPNAGLPTEHTPVSLTRMGESSFENTAKGTREGMPFRSLTGGRGDRLVLDDPNNVITVEGVADRELAARIFRESATTRINDPLTSAIVIMGQRTHEGDVSGVALEIGGYIHLRLPMEFDAEKDPDDPLTGPCETPIFTDPRVDEGELLWPERFPRETVERDKSILGPYAVAGQYAQRPTQRGGSTFKKDDFEIIDAVPHGYWEWVRGWDLAGSDGAKNPGAAYTVGVKLGRHSSGLFLITDVVRGQWAEGVVETKIKNTATHDGAPVLIDLPQDPGSSGKTVVRHLVKKLEGFTVVWGPETGSKELRATPVASQAQVGNIKLLRGPWNAAFLDEISHFPKGTYKDQVDALSRAFARLVKTQTADIGLVGPRLLRMDGS